MIARTEGRLPTGAVVSLFVSMVIVLAFPSFGHASYRIQLKNGSEWITNEYRQSDGATEFRMPGGLVTLSDDLIQSIDESDRPYIDDPSYPAVRSEPEVIAGPPRQDVPDPQPAPGKGGHRMRRMHPWHPL